MRKLLLLSVVAGLFFASCGMKSEAPSADSTSAVVDSAVVVDSASAVADTTAAH